MNKPVFRRRTHLLVFMLALLSAAATLATELPPGGLTNPEGLQRFQGVAYNSALDEYLLIYQGGDVPQVRRLDIEGTLIGPAIPLDKAIGIADVGLVYNPDENQYLAIYRSDQEIFGRYLDSRGQPLASRFRIGTGGQFGVAYSRTSRRYLVVWRKAPAPIQVIYAFIDGDSTAPKPIIKTAALSNGDNAQTAWASGSNKFLVVYTRELGAAKEDVFGRIVNGSGSGISAEFAIMGGDRAQTSPLVGYASSGDVFLVAVEDWKNALCCRADVAGQRVNSSGNKVGGRFDIVATGNGGWDVPGPIGFNQATGQFIATSYVEPRGFAREVDPATSSLGPKIEVANQLSVPIAIATRPDGADPQALILTRSNLGGDGVHAHIVHLSPGPPAFTSTKIPDGAFGVPYSGGTPVTGGTPPLTYQLLSNPSTLAPGIIGPHPNTGIFSGTPTAPGTFGPFTVKVTDKEGRAAQAALTHTIGLSAPHPLSPVSSATADRTPTFEWDASPGATGYRLVVENITDGGTPINQPNIVGTTFTPGTNLPAGKLYQWKVQASGGGVQSPFSDYALFEIDTLSPPPVVLTGSILQTVSPVTNLLTIDASSEHDNTRSREKLVDGKDTTSWMSSGTTNNVPEHVTVDLGAVYEVRRIALRSNRGLRFPKDFRLQISSQPDPSFVTLAALSAFNASGSTWYPFDVVPTMGRYVKIDITKKGFHRGYFWAEISEIEILGLGQASQTFEYRWQSPADDAGSGSEPVASYDLRIMAGDQTTFDYASATRVTWTPTPVLGAEQSVRVEGLPVERQFAAALTSIDDAGNRSALSNIVVLSTPGVPPAAITDLGAFNPGKTTLELSWTAPAEDGASGTAVTEYHVRHSTTPIDSGNFGSATEVGNEPVPAAPGTKQSMTVQNLATNTMHYFAIVSKDDIGNMSPISNVVSMATLDGEPPNAITDFSARLGAVTIHKISPLTAIDASSERTDKGFLKENLVDGNLDTHWSSIGTENDVNEHITVDLGAPFNVARVRLRSDVVQGAKFPTDFEIQIGNNPSTGFTTLASISAFVATESTWYDFLVTPTVGRYLKILVTKKSLHRGSFWAQIAELEAYQQLDFPDGVTLTWTAPGDDGDQGTADSYDVRFSRTEMVDDADFNAATPVDATLIPTPQPAGFPETISVGGLPPGQVFWVAIKTWDDNANVSALSNVLEVVTP